MTPAPLRLRAARAVHRLAAKVQKLAPRRAGLFGTAILLVASVSFGVARGGHADWVAEQAADIRDSIANLAGFQITSIALSGNQQLTREEILGLAGITGRTSLLFLNAKEARERLKANPWIAEASIRKFFPDRLHIVVTERHAFALWQKQGRVKVIARDGVTVEPFVSPHVAHLPLMVGPGAHTRAAEFLDLMGRFPELQVQVRAYVLVAERRWNLKLKNGLEIKLPEANPEQALEQLVALDRDKRLLSRDLLAIDLRVPGRVAVRLSDEAAAARAEALKNLTTKRKGGAA